MKISASARLLLIGSSTSAMVNRGAAVEVSSKRSKKASGSPRSATTCQCSPATCPPHTPIQRCSSCLTGFRPSTPVSRGVAEFVAWYRDYYRI